MKTQFLSFSISILFGSISSSHLDCYFSSIYYNIDGNSYTCKVRNNLNLISPETAEIQSVNGRHDNGKIDDDVKAFYVDTNKTINYFPKGLEKIFKNLKIIWIQNNNLKELHQSDLKPYQSLIYLKLIANSIGTLEKGLFDSNPKLQGIHIERSKLYYIHENVFDKLLPNLKFLNLKINKCIDENEARDSVDIQTVIRVAKERCYSPKFDNIDRNLKDLESESKALNAQNLLAFKSKIDTLEADFLDSPYAKITSLIERFEKLKNFTAQHDLEGNESKGVENWEFLDMKNTGFGGGNCVNCCHLQAMKIVRNDFWDCRGFEELISLKGEVLKIAEILGADGLEKRLNEKINKIEKNIEEKLQKILDIVTNKAN